jgi:hypothetical protein
VRSVTSLRLRRALLDGECNKSDRHVLSCNGLIATHSGAVGTPGKSVVPLFAVFAVTDSDLLRLPCGADCAGMDSEYITSRNQFLSMHMCCIQLLSEITELQ